MAAVYFVGECWQAVRPDSRPSVANDGLHANKAEKGHIPVSFRAEANRSSSGTEYLRPRGLTAQGQGLRHRHERKSVHVQCLHVGGTRPQIQECTQYAVATLLRRTFFVSPSPGFKGPRMHQNSTTCTLPRLVPQAKTALPCSIQYCTEYSAEYSTPYSTKLCTVLRRSDWLLTRG